MFLKSLCTGWIVSAKTRAKTVFGHLKPFVWWRSRCRRVLRKVPNYSEETWAVVWRRVLCKTHKLWARSSSESWLHLRPVHTATNLKTDKSKSDHFWFVFNKAWIGKAHDGLSPQWESNPWPSILGNPGATSRDDAIFRASDIFGRKFTSRAGEPQGTYSCRTSSRSGRIPSRWLARKSCDRVTRLELLDDWPEKYFSGQSAGRNSTTSGTGSVRVSSQGLSSSWSKLSPKNIASSRLVAPGFPRMMTFQIPVGRSTSPLFTFYPSHQSIYD